MLQSEAVAFRDAALSVLKRWQYVQEIADELTGAPWNMDAPAAAELVRQFSLLSTPALVYVGDVAQAEPYPFDKALARARGGS